MQGTQRTVGSPFSRWDFHAWHICQAPGGARTFHDRGTAALWLKQFKTNPTVMAGIRSVVAGHGTSPGGMTDDKVLEELAWQLSKGVLHVHRVPPPRTAWRTAQGESAPADPPVISQRPTPSQAGSAPPPLRQAEEADTFSSQTDAVGTAAVLRRAAASGTPFCEECAKAAAAAARKAA